MNVMKLTAVAALSLGLAGGTALAQTALVEVSDQVIVEPFGLDADTVDDLDVYSSNGQDIGDVEDVVGSDQQTPTHLVVDFDDDDGYPDRDDVLVPIESFTLENDRLVISLTPEEVSALPTWND